MKNLLKKLFSPKYPETYGDFRARQLANGKWVLWNDKKSEAMDLRYHGYTWGVHIIYWRDCICSSRKKIHKIGLSAVSIFRDSIKP